MVGRAFLSHPARLLPRRGLEDVWRGALCDTKTGLSLRRRPSFRLKRWGTGPFSGYELSAQFLRRNRHAQRRHRGSASNSGRSAASAPRYRRGLGRSSATPLVRFLHAHSISTRRTVEPALPPLPRPRKVSPSVRKGAATAFLQRLSYSPMVNRPATLGLRHDPRLGERHPSAVASSSSRTWCRGGAFFVTWGHTQFVNGAGLGDFQFPQPLPTLHGQIPRTFSDLSFEPFPASARPEGGKEVVGPEMVAAPSYKRRCAGAAHRAAAYTPR